jgi:hypothetical protein
LLLRRAAYSDDVEVSDEVATTLRVLLALELSIDLARLEALRADGHDATMRWRQRTYVIRVIKDALREDLATGTDERLDRLWRVLSHVTHPKEQR